MIKKQTLIEIFSEALVYYKKKNFKSAEILCNKILTIDPHHFKSLSLLATISAVLGDFEKAKKLIKQVVEIEPTNKSALNNLGTAYRELGEIKKAENTYLKILEIDQNHTNANYNLGLIYHSLKELKKAKKFFKKTVEVQSNYAVAYYSLANVHVELKEVKDALSCYQKAIEINPNLVSAYNNLGLLHRELNDFKSSISCYENAIKINPKYANAHHNLAEIYKEIGNFQKSIKSSMMAIQCEPNNLMNYYFLSQLKEDILKSDLKKKIEQIIENKKDTKSNHAYGNYLLAKYERGKKNYEKELDYLKKGHLNFYISKKDRFDLNIKYCFDDVIKISKEAEVEKTKEIKKYNENPIFIFGVPRSGSTLVEKIIASGKNFVPIGEEIGVIGNYVISKVLKKESLLLGKSDDLRNELYEIYKDKNLIFEKYKYTFTDKSLDNFFYLKIIKSVYPNAKLINCKRNTLSSIMSIFQNNLTTLSWAHDLDNIFKYFNNYFEIVEKFNKENPNQVYNLNFEKLINNPEEESKKLMEYCNLPWDRKCLEFYKRKDLTSKTASNIQIREAIYKHPAGKYLPYKRLLEKYGKKYSWFN